jgi:hypothetical protein
LSLRLECELERERYRPGESVRGTVLVLEGGPSRRLEVTLEYREKTEEDFQATVRTLRTGELHNGDLTTGASYPFEIVLPADALPSFGSAHGELYWELDARSDEPGRDSHERRRIEVASTVE